MDDEKERSKRYSLISPQMSDIGAQSPTNEHIDRLAGILLTYNFYEKELGALPFESETTTRADWWACAGYVQGMSDLCAPVYVVMAADEELTFWCFVEYMDRMVRIELVFTEREMLMLAPQKQNFLRDQSGMKKQLLTLQELIGVMDPELYRHLGLSLTSLFC
jgi:hypothetical protein